MPGSILGPQPTLVMPQTLCTAFNESRAYEELRNNYRDSTTQASQLAQTSRRTFKLARRLDSSHLATLKAFYESVDGGLRPFIFYNPYEGSPVGSNFDATGVSSVGRVVVAFRNNWGQTTTFQRTDVADLTLVEQGFMDSYYESLAGFGPHGAVVSATLKILTSHIEGVPDTGGAICTIDGLGLFSRGWLSGGGAWTLRTDTHSVTAGQVLTMIAIFAIGTAFPVVLTTPEDFLVYDCWVDVVYADAATQTFRPTTALWDSTTWGEGTVLNPGNAIDGSTSTYALVEATNLSTLNFQGVLVLRNFR